MVLFAFTVQWFYGSVLMVVLFFDSSEGSISFLFLLQRRTVLSSLVNMISDLRNSLLYLVVTLTIIIIMERKRYPYI